MTRSGQKLYPSVAAPKLSTDPVSRDPVNIVSTRQWGGCHRVDAFTVHLTPLTLLEGFSVFFLFLILVWMREKMSSICLGSSCLLKSILGLQCDFDNCFSFRLENESYNQQILPSIVHKFLDIFLVAIAGYFHKI